MASKNLYILILILGTSLILHSKARAHPAPSFDEDEDDFFKSADSEEQEDPPPPQPPSNPKGERSLDSSGHDDHKGHIQSVPNPPDTSSDAKQGFIGGSVSNFNETCDPKECNTVRNLWCDKTKPQPRRCECLAGHIYIRNQEKCYPISKTERERCEFHEQCNNGPSGFLSRCDHVKGTCECWDTELGNRDVVRHNQKCVLKRNFGETCEADAECESTMRFNAYCAPHAAGSNPLTEICQCKKNFVWDNLHKECLLIADKGLSSMCKSSLQCTASPMGDLSRCNDRTEKCECNDFKNPGQDNVAFYDKNGACYEKKFMNSTCTISEECKASISTEAECLPQKDEGYGGTMLLICQCPPGKRCAPLGDGGGALGLRSINSLVLVMFFVYRFLRV